MNKFDKPNEKQLGPSDFPSERLFRCYCKELCNDMLQYFTLCQIINKRGDCNDCPKNLESNNNNENKS